MIRVKRSLVCNESLEETFAFVADFENLARWDPGIAVSERLDDGPLAKGSSFRIVAKFLGRRVPMTYRVTEFEPPYRIVYEGVGGNLHAVDDIRFDRTGSGTKVQYRADFRFPRALRWAECLMRPAFHRLASRAMGGMSDALKRKAA